MDAEPQASEAKQVQHDESGKLSRSICDSPASLGEGLGWGFAGIRFAWGEAPPPTPSPEEEGGSEKFRDLAMITTQFARLF